VKPKVPTGKVYVPGYTKEDGTVVKAYYRDAGRGGPPTTQTAVQRQAAGALKGKR
jgi:hypothetical protein